MCIRDRLDIELELLLKQRHALYKQGDLKIIVDKNDSSEDVVNKILKLIPTVLKTTSNQ